MMQYEKIFGINVYSSNSIKPLTKIEYIYIQFYMHLLNFTFFVFIKD